MRQLLPLALSANTIALMWLVGNRRVLGWWMAVCGQVGWFAFIVLFQAWGLTPMAVALTVVYIRNLIRWRRDHDGAQLRGSDAGRVPASPRSEDPAADTRDAGQVKAEGQDGVGVDT